MENAYLLPLHPVQSGPVQSSRNDGYSFDYEITDQDEPDQETVRSADSRLSTRRTSFKRSNSRNEKNFKPAVRWPCRPCGLLLGTCHILLGLSVIIFDVATNWITETVFAVTAGICFVNSGIVGLIAARKLDRGTVTLFVIFSLLSLGLCLVLIIECSAALNHVCTTASTISTSEFIFDQSTQLENDLTRNDDDPSNSVGCIHGIEARVRAALLILSLAEGVVDIVSIFIGAKSLCNRYSADLENPSSPYHALIYGDLAPPPRPKRIVQDVGQELTSGNDGRGGRRSYSRLLLEYLVPSPPSIDEESTGQIV